ncbi:plasmid pRiA4b ORF-3 family protein [Hymenobacter sp. H14-R3]|uniref:plasmid pRiA4b ORF-3 family protein n=1 Tax=Hymenobacter sp. H14-R3 TaxID=3046308 RepID=UPI0024BA39F3|nr:plasmid pRiA4b ORF-3 family protein [Hymenobacter sp. H14-R3]MDJ0365065.1 plasmid pRiA4b ORF-3 family protein [Hymenobacter sp. H14-R3]
MANILTLKATLRYTQPAVWRRLVLPDTLTFWDLHFALQLAFGWENAHLFEFSTGRGSPGDFLTGSPPMQPDEADYLPEWWHDPRQVALAEILRAPQDKISYVYDMGDHWEHQLVVEKIAPLAPNAPLPPVHCPDGRRAGPPEDIGSIPGYEMLLAALAEKAAGTRKRMPSHFAGLGKYDPDAPELDIVNENLAQLALVVADENASIEAYQQQLAARPQLVRQPPTPDELKKLLSGMMGPPPAAPKKKPK